MKNTFLTSLEEVTTTTRTTNGDLAYTSTLNKNLDFFGQAGSKRGSGRLVKNLFADAYEENPKLALMNLLHLRDIRKGLGERQLSVDILSQLADNDPDVFKALVANEHYSWSNLGRWDDVAQFGNHPNVGPFVTRLVGMQLMKDFQDMKKGKSTSLLAKWLPSESTVSITKKALVRHYIRTLFDGKGKLYRQLVSGLRQYIGLVETHLTDKDYTFDYTKLPSKATLKYVKAFLRNDGTRYKEYVKSIRDGAIDVSKKADNIDIHEYANASGRGKGTLVNALWKQLPKNEDSKTALVVLDTSGSMTIPLPGAKPGISSITVLDVSKVLAIYMAERLKGDFKDKVLTFSRKPRFIELPDGDFTRKLDKLDRYSEVSNTNIEATYQAILEAGKKSSPEDMPDYVLILSDMQFDVGAVCNESTLESAKKAFEAEGLKMPKMIYWNLNVHNVTFPARVEKDILFLSGFSKALFNSVLKLDKLPDSPVDLMYNVLKGYEDWAELALS